MNEDDELCGWTIYRDPIDYPGHFVVRQWWVEDAGVIVHRTFAVVCHTIEEAREQVPPGAICFPRDPDDDPVIVETWM